MSRLLRRQELGRIEPVLSPQPSFTPACPTSRAQCKAAPKDAAISYQASRVRSKRRPVHGFEPGTLFGTKIVTKKNPFQTDPLSIFENLCTLVERYTLDLMSCDYDEISWHEACIIPEWRSKFRDFF
jgi:hypothetical protein